MVFRLNGGSTTIDQIPIASLGVDSKLSSVGATALGNYLLVGWWKEKANMLLWEAYDITKLPSPISPDFLWTPALEQGGIPEAFQLPDSSLLPPSAFGPVASMDWYSLGGNDFYLVTSFMPNEKHSTPNIMVTPMGSNVLPEKNTEGVYPIMLIQGFPDTINNPVMVARDPAGRMTLWLCDGHDQWMLTISNNEEPSSAWSTVTDLTNWQKIETTMSVSQPAVTAWATGGSYPYTYSDGSITTRQDIYQITLFPDKGGDSCCEIQSFGIAEMLPNAVCGKLLPSFPYTANGKTYSGVVTGIFDAPFPMPASNVQSNALEAGTILGSVIYGVTEGHSTQRSTDFSVGGGFSNQFQTTAGGGPAWSISVKSGATINRGSDEYSDLLNSVSIETQVNANGTGIVSEGSIQASNVNYTGTYYRILDVNGNPLPNCPVNCTIVPTLVGGFQPTAFPAYLVNPGDLSSYTLEQINAKASQLGLLQPGETDYVTDVIEKNALSFAENQNYLLWSQNQNSQSVPGYLDSSDTWHETGWYLDSSIYVGLDVGTMVSVEVPPLGVSAAGFEMQTLAGVDLSASHSTTTEQSQQIQVVIQEMQMPIAKQGTDIVELTVQIYFLPANPRWMTELEKCSGLNLTDTNSSPWRIFFLVTSYKSLDGSISYP